MSPSVTVCRMQSQRSACLASLPQAPCIQPMLFRLSSLSPVQRGAHLAAQHQPRHSRVTQPRLPAGCSSKRSMSVCRSRADGDAELRQQSERNAAANNEPRLSNDAAAAVFTMVAIAALLSHGSPAEAAGLLVREEPANALSLPTWAIHVSSVIEWIAAMGLVWRYAEVTGEPCADPALAVWLRRHSVCSRKAACTLLVLHVSIGLHPSSAGYGQRHSRWHSSLMLSDAPCREASVEGPHVGHGAAVGWRLQRVHVPLFLQQPPARCPRRLAGDELASGHACPCLPQCCIRALRPEACSVVVHEHSQLRTTPSKRMTGREGTWRRLKAAIVV